VIPLGQRTYLEAKAEGDHSMSEKARCRKTINRQARRDPDDTVKAKLLEAKYPNRNRRELDKMVDVQGFPIPRRCSDREIRGVARSLLRTRSTEARPQYEATKGTKWTPKSS
jgi:hypothetical protein